jgi:type II secretory pathway component PulF
VQQALIYPAFLALVGAVLVTIFIAFMVPQLSGFMAQTGGVRTRASNDSRQPTTNYFTKI